MSVEYDPFSAEIIHGDNHGIYKRLRDESPVHYMEKWDAWALSRFGDVWWACEGEVAIQEILARFPNYEIETSGLEKYSTEFVQGYSALPVRLQS